MLIINLYCCLVLLIIQDSTVVAPLLYQFCDSPGKHVWLQTYNTLGISSVVGAAGDVLLLELAGNLAYSSCSEGELNLTAYP